MKVFACSACGHALFFENVQCNGCGRRLAYVPDRAVVSPLEAAEAQAVAARPDPLASVFVALAPVAGGERYRLCKNAVDHGACNWAVPVGDDTPFCRACRLNEIIPNLSSPHALEGWLRIERAKRRLVYTLLELGLKVESRREHPSGGLRFAFKEDTGGAKVMTGHDEGLITLNLAEADTPFREKLREQMGEAYRTLLGHFRHEIGHYYWDRLIAGSERLGVRPDVAPDASKGRLSELKVTTRNLHFHDFDDLLKGWVPLTVALNSLNRSMGLADVYPFVLSERAIRKLRFVHDVIENVAAG